MLLFNPNQGRISFNAPNLSLRVDVDPLQTCDLPDDFIEAVRSRPPSAALLSKLIPRSDPECDRLLREMGDDPLHLREWPAYGGPREVPTEIARPVRFQSSMSASKGRCDRCSADCAACADFDPNEAHVAKLANNMARARAAKTKEKQ